MDFERTKGCTVPDRVTNAIYSKHGIPSKRNWEKLAVYSCTCSLKKKKKKKGSYQEIGICGVACTLEEDPKGL